MVNVVFGFGRCNPPTLGHYEMIKQLVEISDGLGARAEMFIIDGEETSKDKTKNPLTSKQRLAVLRSWFPKVHFDTASSAYHVMELLDVQGKRPISLVAGTDRVPGYRKLLDYYGYTGTSIVELNRDTGLAKGVSATLVRKAAMIGDFESFAKMMPSIEKFDIQSHYGLVRKVLLEHGDGQVKI